jgi:hypothetical protein
MRQGPGKPGLSALTASSGPAPADSTQAGTPLVLQAIRGNPHPPWQLVSERDAKHATDEVATRGPKIIAWMTKRASGRRANRPRVPARLPLATDVFGALWRN